MRQFITLVIFVLCFSVPAVVFAESSDGQTLTNEDIVALHRAGLSSDFIIDRINTASSHDFDLSVDEVLHLATDVKIPEAVLKAMNDAMAKANASDISGGPVMDESVASLHPGVYMVTSDGPVFIEPEPVNKIKKAPWWKRVKNTAVNAELKGEKGRVSVGSNSEFLIVTDEYDITEYILIDLEEEDDKRIFQVGHISFSNNNHEQRINDDQRVLFEPIRTDSNQFKVSLSNLEPGEYGFFLITNAIEGAYTGRIYTFSVQ